MSKRPGETRPAQIVLQRATIAGPIRKNDQYEEYDSPDEKRTPDLAHGCPLSCVSAIGSGSRGVYSFFVCRETPTLSVSLQPRGSLSAGVTNEGPIVKSLTSPLRALILCNTPMSMYQT